MTNTISPRSARKHLPFTKSLTPALSLDVNRNSNNTRNARSPPVFRYLDRWLCVIHASFNFSTVPTGASRCRSSFSNGSWLRVGSEIDLRRGEELKLIYDHKLGRRRASTDVDMNRKSWSRLRGWLTGGGEFYSRKEGAVRKSRGNIKLNILREKNDDLIKMFLPSTYEFIKHFAQGKLYVLNIRSRALGHLHTCT